jgi:hypothetical protein
MSPALKLLIGLAAVVLMGWGQHSLLGQGEALIASLEAQARETVAKAEVAGTEVRLERNPLSRQATLSGPADAFQREGRGSLKGLNDRVLDVEGISSLRWADEPAKTAIPLFVELLLQLLAAYLLGIALARLFWGRRKREGFY